MLYFLKLSLPMKIDAFIKEIRKRRDIREVVHHEVISASPARNADPFSRLPLEIKGALADKLGIKTLYDHQAFGVEIIRGGKNLVIMTPTASGKSLIYNIPVVESLLKDPESTALYIFPLKGLEQDQFRAFNNLTVGLPIERPGRPPEGGDGGGGKKRRAFTPGLSEIYDGDTTAYRRKKIREAPPAVILTNPDMLHLAINAFNDKWEPFLSNLKYVIIDEVHTYRGVFGSHVAHVLRRLRRILKKYGSEPQFIACSATIANPAELASMLTGLEFELITKSGAPAGRRNFLFINPPPDESPYTMATRLFTASVKAGFKTIAFTKARKITELMHSWVKDGHPEISGKICSYRAGFLPEERREIEQRLFRGELSGVISTSALELGVDIGGLDVCILVGYPGTIASTWQRSGRVGRSGRDSLIIMVALQDALDQFFMRNPDDFFRRSVEAAVLDVNNPVILKPHLLCAASETYLKSTDEIYNVALYETILRELEKEEKIRYWQKGDIWYPRKRNPQREVSIRATGENFLIVTEGGSLVGESSSARVFFELHPGAVYLHKGTHYKVKKLDLGGRRVTVVQKDDINYHTSATTNEDTEIISTDDTTGLRGVEINYGALRVTSTVTGYRRKEIYTERNLGEFSLTLPPSVFTTKGVWMEVDGALLEEVNEKEYSVAGSLHALEHAAIAALPLYALCDRMDLGGVSYPMNPELESAAIFIYDGFEGGVGLAKRGFECVRDWFESTLRLMAECDCEVSCPSCTQDPKCGNNNEPLDKRGAILILERWLEKG